MTFDPHNQVPLNGQLFALWPKLLTLTGRCEFNAFVDIEKMSNEELEFWVFLQILDASLKTHKKELVEILCFYQWPVA